MTQINNDQIFDQVQTLLVELFELDANDIHLDSHLYQDLDLDSIDAVDLVVRLQNFTGKKSNPMNLKMFVRLMMSLSPLQICSRLNNDNASANNIVSISPDSLPRRGLLRH